MKIQTEFHDFSHRADLGRFLNQRGLIGKGVEVGTLFGAYATDILKTWEGHLYCVDPWRNQPDEVYFDGANKHDMEQVWASVRSGIGQNPRCTLLRMMSLNAVGKFEDGELDFVYLDGNHGLPFIRADIPAWWPKVKIGGLVCGHDYFTRYDQDTNSDAGTAVAELAEALGIRVHVTWDTSWWFVKTQDADDSFRRACMDEVLPRPVYTDNLMLECVVVLPVARFDFHLAKKLLAWMKIPQQVPFIISASPDLTAQQREELLLGVNHTVIHISPVKELGYFGTPNQMFKGALEYCERNFPGRAVLWVEADAIPMRATWVDEIMAEYQLYSRPFLADFQRAGALPHTTGNAVYHPNWRKLAPSLAELGTQACGWDSLCSHDLAPRCHPAKTIQQIWRPPLPITAEWAKANIRPETALFHQCKDGSLIDVLCAQNKLPLIPLAPALCESTYEKDRHRLTPEQNDGPQGEVFKPSKQVVELKPRSKGIARMGTPRVAILIVTFKRDMDFLHYCLASIATYARGFHSVILCVPEAERGLYDWVGRNVNMIQYFNEPAGKGMLAHELQIMHADDICGDVDFVLHLDADCMFWKNVTPTDYLPDGKALCVRELYSKITNQNRFVWRKVVDDCTGIFIEADGMVRHPQIHPVEVYPLARNQVEKTTGKRLDIVVLNGRNEFPQSFAEFPVIYAVGRQFLRDRYCYVEYDKAADRKRYGIPPEQDFQYIYDPTRDFAVEFWSHGGMARYRAEADCYLAGQLPKFCLK